ncbi:MAG: RNA polymerase sigma-70 factor [Bacteroidales bacterium]|jgi:RNA polymerase sigma-70 factor (ECF subfamily)|nr:RNA polymerase sigma-70 factor [Bacteroidales bacterium]
MQGREDIEQLFRLYYKPMCLYAMHYVKDASIVEDIVQDAFVSLWKRVQAGVIVNTPKTYLVKIVRNGCIDYLRHNSTYPMVALPNDLNQEISDDEVLARSIDESIIWDAIDSLPPGRRKMLLLHKRDGLKHKDIACLLGVSEGTVRNQISRALKSLKKKLNKRNIIFSHK